MATAKKTAGQTSKTANAKRLTAEKRRKDAEAEAANLEVTSAAEWKAKAAAGTKLLLPSGFVCIAVNKGIDTFVEQGKVPNMLMPMVEAAIAEGEGKPPTKAELKETVKDVESIKEVMDFINAIVVDCVLSPTLALPPADRKDRDPAVLYTDEASLEDRMFVFQWVVGGTRDVERFREQSAAVVADISDGSADEQEA